MIHDAVILGGGVAGASAALALRAGGRSVALVERQVWDDDATFRPDWITAQGIEAMKELGVEPGSWLGEPFEGAAFHPADLSREAIATSQERPAFRLDYTRLARELMHRVGQAGVCRVEGRRPESVETAEDRAVVAFDDGESVEGRFLLIADGAAGGLGASGDPPSRWIVQAVVLMDETRGAAGTDGHLHWILGLDGGEGLAVWWYDRSSVAPRPRGKGGRASRSPEATKKGRASRPSGGEGAALVVQLHVGGSEAAATARLHDLLASAVERRLLPAAPCLEAAAADAPGADDVLRITARPAPHRFALDMDSHVGKRSLLIGDAGGFCCQVSREGIYPAVWSARIAADTILRALPMGHAQDELRGFSAAWRTTMADYLRPPNTDLQFLLPLIFTNQRMADRLAAAIWNGRNI